MDPRNAATAVRVESWTWLPGGEQAAETSMNEPLGGRGTTVLAVLGALPYRCI